MSDYAYLEEDPRIGRHSWKWIDTLEEYKRIVFIVKKYPGIMRREIEEALKSKSNQRPRLDALVKHGYLKREMGKIPHPAARGASMAWFYFPGDKAKELKLPKRLKGRKPSKARRGMPML